ncbi:glycosyltransferase family 39 protein [Butyrivibrio sp. LC3010]|uniref:glycosyltransferase family 39 protein n=1 Tax=Butyrivibrio sp. LC3010 TaxID=1280680 RepID=UPI000422C0FD|nr:glycosyltransferase family 39 protein [Butyrivibrio sp. LC3010]
MKNKTSINYICVLGCMLLSAIVFVGLASTTTSPTFYFKGTDSNIFQVIGKGWCEGLIPYKDLFDQKGPAIFFINMLGYMLLGNRYGIFLLQILFMLASEIIIFLIFRRIYSEKISLIIASFGIFAFMWNYDTGNSSEEYANPFLLACLYCFTNWLHDKNENRKNHDPIYAFVYGITFGFCMMSRLTNAISVCVVVFFILIYLIISKSYMNILKNIIAFILGTCCMVVPFMIYFALNHTTYDFWFGTILYNFMYAAKSKTSLSIMAGSIVSQLGSYALMVVGIIYATRRKFYEGILFFVIGLSTEVLFMHMLHFGHYYMIAFPYLPIAFYELILLLRDSNHKSKIAIYINKLIQIFVICLLGITAARTIKQFYSEFRFYMTFPGSDSDKKYEQQLNFVKNIPANDRDSVALYEMDSSIYIVLDIQPKCKYFTLQDWQAGFSEELKNNLIDEFETKSPKWIACNHPNETIITELLQTNYEIVYEEDIPDDDEETKLILYRQK